MKKNFTLFLVLLFVVGIIVGGCGQTDESVDTDSETETEPDAGEEREDIHITMAAGPMGGGFYTMMGPFIEFLPADIPGLYVTGIEGGTVENIRMANAGEAQIGFVWIQHIIDAIEGEGVFEGKPHDNVAGLLRASIAMQQIITTADSGIESLEDLATMEGIRFGPGEVGQWPDHVETVFNAAGFSMDDIEANGGEIVYAGVSSYPQMVRDGHVDAFFVAGPYENPHNAGLELQSHQPIRIIPLDEELLGHRFNIGTQPAGTYEGQDEDVDVILHHTGLVISKDLPEDLVYEITKSIYNNIDKVIEVAPHTERFFEQGPQDFVDGIPRDYLHPGALKFYEEVGAFE